MMTLTVQATYENGTFKPSQPLTLPEGAAVRLTVSPLDEGCDETNDPLAAVIGICDGPPDGADNHDKYIYGKIRP